MKPTVPLSAHSASFSCLLRPVPGGLESRSCAGAHRPSLKGQPGLQHTSSLSPSLLSLSLPLRLPHKAIVKRVKWKHLSLSEGGGISTETNNYLDFYYSSHSFALTCHPTRQFILSILFLQTLMELIYKVPRWVLNLPPRTFIIRCTSQAWR